MPKTVRAIYSGGVFHPLDPVELTEAAVVEVVFSDLKSTALTEEEVNRVMDASKTYHEWFELSKLLPPTDDEDDIVEALQRNRRLSGEWSASAEKQHKS